ncbi:hypothetical protein EDC04DRAFT_3094728 [Pisolithus marmoratus]|nr:hypothetical protein EDC04DRAFT_3094728 [Pisolithus marmoratus]
MRFTASQITSVSLCVGSIPHVLEIGSLIEYCTVATWKEYLGCLADTSPHSSALISLLASMCCRCLADTFGHPPTLIFPQVSACLRYLVDTFICSTANQTLLCPIANCHKAGGCGLPGHQPKGALPLPSPSPVVPLCEASRASPVIDPTLMAVSTEVHPQSSTLLTVGPSLSEPFSLTPHSLSLSPSSTLIPSASHTGPTTHSYAHPLDENYAWAYYEAHAKTFEVEQLLKQSAQVQFDLQSIVHVVVWVRAQEAPRHIHVVNPTPGTFVPAAHQIITDLLTADKVSVYCQDLWFEQLLTAPLVVPKTDATVFLCDASLAVSDIIGLDVELSRVSTSRKHLPDTILESTSPLKSSPDQFPQCSTLASTPHSLVSPESPPSQKSGSGKKMFPWKYVCDMYPGMTMLSVLGTAEEIEKKFPLAFPNTDFMLSTFYKHRKPFMDASTLGLVESRVVLGHTEGGKWALLKADVERFMKEGSLNMGSSVNTLSLPSTFNPSLLPQDSNQQDTSYSLNTETTVAPELLGEIGNDMDMTFSFTDFDLSFVLNDLQSDNTLLLNLEESQYNSVFDDLLQDNAS